MVIKCQVLFYELVTDKFTLMEFVIEEKVNKEANDNLGCHSR